MLVLLAALTARAGAAFALPAAGVHLAPGSRDHRGGRRLLAGRFLVTPLALISTLLVLPAAPGILLRDRIPDTVIGAAVGIGVVLAPTAWRRLRARHQHRRRRVGPGSIERK
jgi:hypothetical protein